MNQPNRKRRVGRPKLPKGAAKGRIVPVRFTAEDLKAMEAAAKASDKTVSEWVRGTMRAMIQSDWLPTSENINTLPGPIRAYVHDLETRCDPAGDVAALACARDNVAALAARVRELEGQV